MNSYKTVSIIGSGNLAFHLSKAIINSSTYKLQGIFGRTEARVKRLADQVGCEFDMLDDPHQFNSDIAILCVSDDAIQEVLNQNHFGGKTLVIHIAGSVSLSVFDAHGVKNGGVFYPLQTFSKNREVDFHGIPIFIEAQQNDALVELQALAFDIGGISRELNSEKRLQLHLAAVFASNFTNSLMAGAETILQDIGLEFRVLHPLLKEVVEKSARIGPVAAQTGPAKRSDLETLKKHEDALKNEEMRQLYRLMSDLIRRQSNV